MSNEDYKDRIKREAGEGSPDLIDKEGAFYLFFSFDLVNSTKFKSIYPNEWLKVTLFFYQIILGGIDKYFKNPREWKYVGDEILIYKKISSITELYDCLPKTYDLLQDSINKLHSQHKNTKTILSIKAAIWCAKVHSRPSDDPSENRNMLVSGHGLQSEGVDFLGPDIDIGFRIAKYSTRQRLVVSADLTYLLYLEMDEIGKQKNEPVDLANRLAIIFYEDLKGIWSGRKYPIIWYEKNWDLNYIHNSFYYDEHFTSEIVNRIREEGWTAFSNIAKVYNDLGLQERMQQLVEYLRGLQEDTPALPLTIPPANQAEVHCVAVCFSPEGEILVAKRKGDKKRLPDKWEFGCGQLIWNDKFEDSLSRSYKEDFNADLDFSPYLMPIKTFYIHDADSNRNIPGIIFVANILDKATIKCNKHAEIKWLSEDDESINEGDAVPEFYETIRMARQIRSQLVQLK